MEQESTKKMRVLAPASHTTKKGSVLRVFLQNPDGVMATGKELDDHRAMLNLREWDVDVIALPESKRNWQQEWIQNKWRGEVKRIWPHAKVYCSSIDTPVQKYASYVQGGVSLIVMNSWESRVMTHDSNHLGRWVWVTLRGRKDE